MKRGSASFNERQTRTTRTILYTEDAVFPYVNVGATALKIFFLIWDHARQTAIQLTDTQT